MYVNVYVKVNVNEKKIIVIIVRTVSCILYFRMLRVYGLKIKSFGDIYIVMTL